MEAADAPDVVVVGGGAAGLSAATTVRAGGATTVLVSEGPLGGDCTWHGCVPSKALLEAAAAGASAVEAVERARSAVARLARLEGEAVLSGAGVTVLRARARLRSAGDGPPLVHVGTRVLRARSGVVLATGSRPVTSVPGLEPGADGARTTTTDGWLDALGAHVAVPDPGPVVVVGGGASGVELAQALARLGLRVRLLERAGHLLPDLPPAVGRLLADRLVADGAEVVPGAGPDDVAAAARPGCLTLVAVGRRPDLRVLDGWGGPPLQASSGGVVVDPTARTAFPGLLAAGDVTSLPRSTHLAAAAGRVAAATLLGRAARLESEWAPRVVWTDPEVAVVGTLAGPRRTRVPLSRVDRSVLAGGSRGWVELWTGLDGGVRGALLVGPRDGELVSEVALAGRTGLTVSQWLGGIEGLGSTSAHHAYPSWAWVWREVADRVLGR